MPRALAASAIARNSSCVPSNPVCATSLAAGPDVLDAG